MTVAIRETAQDSLARIRSGHSKNDFLAIMAFADLGVDVLDVEPRVNVLTYNAWKAEGRQVARGARSVRVPVWIPIKAKDGGKDKMVPRDATLFHVSQTIPLDAPKGTRPAAWNNPRLVKEGTYQPDVPSVI